MAGAGRHDHGAVNVTNDPVLPRGFRAAGVHCGIRPRGDRLDLGLLLADEAWPAAAVFTRNRLLGAHVPVCRDHLRRSGGRVRAVLVNAGNANCATGEQGVADAHRVAAALAGRLGCATEEVLFLSTGVIGAPLPVPRIVEALPALAEAVAVDGVKTFARAITTTDTHEKIATAIIDRAGGAGRAVGIAKGAGMIHPDMATMFGFLLADVAATAPAELLCGVVDRSFHRLTVDGDTSPNDTVLLWTAATGGAADEALAPAVIGVAQQLCRMIARDGEGATRLVTVQVRGAESEAEATHVGRVIATSPLTKTAIAGRDPNWGRILAAAGRAGVPFDVARSRVWIGDAVLFADGRPHPEHESSAHRHLSAETEVTLGIDLARGPATADVWTCDLTGDYVRINADYRT